VDAQRVKILHVAHRDAVVVGVANDLILDLLPALERLLDQDLGGERQGPGGHVPEFLFVIGKPRPKTSKRVSGADDDGVADHLGGLESLLDGVDGDGLGDGDVDLLQCLGKEISILAQLEGTDASTQYSDAVLLEQTHLLHLNAQVESRLASEG